MLYPACIRDNREGLDIRGIKVNRAVHFHRMSGI